MGRTFYLDNAATTSVDPRVLDVMLPFYVLEYANPGSLHRQGRTAKRAVDTAREKICAAIDTADDDELVFTATGTEADNAALLGIVDGIDRPRAHIIVSSFEHHAVLEPAHLLAQRGYEVTYLDPRPDGVVHPDDLRQTIRDDTILVSVMHVNNEIGTVQPIAELAAIAHEAGALFHTDAVQSLGKIAFNVETLRVDAASFSAHKIHGPKGAGALYLRRDTPFAPQMLGGGQEGGRRSGTHNVAGIVGFAAALELMEEERIQGETRRLSGLRDRLIDGVLALPDTALNGAIDALAPHIANIVIVGVEGEAIQLALDEAGIAVSTGSACSSGSEEPSHVLAAIGIEPDRARSAIRFSLGRFTTDDDIDILLATLPGVVERLRAMSPVLSHRQ